jgi:hypothetical protein
MRDYSFTATVRRRDGLQVRAAEPGVRVQALIREEGKIALELCPEHAVSLRDELIRLYPLNLTPTGRRRRRDAKSDSERLASAIQAPGVQATLQALHDHGAGDWQLVAAIARCTGQTEMVVRANLYQLKKARKVESRKATMYVGRGQPPTEWRIVE